MAATTPGDGLYYGKLTDNLLEKDNWTRMMTNTFTLLKAVEAAGGLVLDCDAIYHDLLRTDGAMLSAIETRFPGVVEDGALNRKKLGGIVFADENALLDLNRITHGAVKQEVLRQLSQEPALAAIDAIYLAGLVSGKGQ